MDLHQHTIIGGDLNFTLGAWEIWGPLAQRDPICNTPLSPSL
jgi:hypothetical protein